MRKRSLASIILISSHRRFLLSRSNQSRPGTSLERHGDLSLKLVLHLTRRLVNLPTKFWKIGNFLLIRVLLYSNQCRAESVAMFLGVRKDILTIFGHEGQEANDIIFVSYLTMARAGLLALEFYGKPMIKKFYLSPF